MRSNQIPVAGAIAAFLALAQPASADSLFAALDGAWSGSGNVKLENGKMAIPLETTRELRIEYAPEEAGDMDAYADHFHHYFAYVERPAALDFDVVPKKLSGSSTPTPRVGNNFAAWGSWPYCFVISVH